VKMIGAPATQDVGSLE